MKSAGDATDPRQLREFILNSKEPLILRNFQTNWSAFQGTLADWCKNYDEEFTAAQSGFERMQRRQSSAEPQWERRREAVKITATEFLQQQQREPSEQSKDCDDYWMAMNYKRAHELSAACRDGVHFGCFGFPQVADDCTFWLGAAGANTPCHYDTYGCNIVVQVYGRKSWLLLPPDAPLNTTRIPYEETSVYCAENFYAPSARQLKDLQKLENHAYRCVLEPNDVLIVPRHWWHYVEALETSLSVNYWIPLTADVEDQLEECIVQFLIENFVKNEDKKTLEYLLNPNHLLQIPNDAQIFAILKHLLQTAEALNSVVSAKAAHHAFDYQYLPQADFEKLLKKIPNVCKIPPMTKMELSQFLSENAKRLEPGYEESLGSPLNGLKEILINSICSPSVIRNIKNEFYMRMKKQSNE